MIRDCGEKWLFTIFLQHSTFPLYVLFYMDISQRTTQLKTRNRGFWERMFGVWEEVTVTILADHINTFLVRTYLVLIVLIAKTYQKS